VSDKFVFKGARYRAQLVVFDVRGVPTWADKPVTFSVAVLPATANQYHAFSRGRHVYYGENLDMAWDAVCAYTPGQHFPRQLRKYLTENPQQVLAEGCTQV
jgi:hypothetical protein